MKIARSIWISILFLITLLSCISLASAELIDRGSSWNKFNNSDGSYNLKIHNNIINYFDII